MFLETLTLKPHSCPELGQAEHGAELLTIVARPHADQSENRVPAKNASLDTPPELRPQGRRALSPQQAHLSGPPVLALKVPDASSSQSFGTSEAQSPKRGAVCPRPGKRPSHCAYRAGPWHPRRHLLTGGLHDDKPSGPRGTWEAWRAKDSKDVPGPRSQPWAGQETTGAATSGQRERVRATSVLLGLHWPGTQPPSPCGHSCHHCPLGALHCGPFTTHGAIWQCPPHRPSRRAGPDLESHS